MITQDQLKIVAEYIGYTILNNLKDGWTVTKDGWESYYEYDPRQNDTQMKELMDKFSMELYKTCGGTVGKPDTKKCWWNAIVKYFDKDGEFVADPYHGDTINEAVTLAAIAYVENQQ